MTDPQRVRPLPAALLVTALVAYPFLDRTLHAQTIHAVTDAMIYVLLALGLNIVVGYAGLLDLGYAAFFAIGAYTMGLLNSPVLGSPLYGHAWSFWVVIWIAALVSAGLGVVIGLAIVCNLVAGALGGILIPMVLERVRADPAVASGTFVTTVTDVVGFFSFLGIATLWFGLK